MEWFVTWGLLTVCAVLLVVLLVRRPQDNGSETRLREEIRALRREQTESHAAEQARLHQALNAHTERVSRTLTEAVERRPTAAPISRTEGE